ncbi:MAG: hypothetical protein NBV60_04145 [Erythrobacter sp.]|nr:hypothetical protein [Erythrobacter sp.]
MARGGWVYVLTNKPDGLLYIGVTAEIAREKQLKNWKREWKIALIESDNPTWEPMATDPGSSPG